MRNTKINCHCERSVAISHKKAAMFGLDARIALAIFGALSVISGAALYSAIQTARATSLLTDMREIGKAWEQYYLDTGQDLTPYGSTIFNLYHRNTSDFILDQGVSGWNGPYLPYRSDVLDGKLLDYSGGNSFGSTGKIYILNINSSNWSKWMDGACSVQPDCYLWIIIHNLSSSDILIFRKVDEIVDNSDGGDNGNFRYYYATDTQYTHIFLKFAPLQ